MNLSPKQAALLHKSQEIIEAKQRGERIIKRRRIPVWMYDGTEAKSIEDVAILMGVDATSAALYVLEGKNVPTDLVRAAERHLKPYRTTED